MRKVLKYLFKIEVHQHKSFSRLLILKYGYGVIRVENKTQKKFIKGYQHVNIKGILHKKVIYIDLY